MFLPVQGEIRVTIEDNEVMHKQIFWYDKQHFMKHCVYKNFKLDVNILAQQFYKDHINLLLYFL